MHMHDEKHAKCEIANRDWYNKTQQLYVHYTGADLESNSLWGNLRHRIEETRTMTVFTYFANILCSSHSFHKIVVISPIRGSIFNLG